MPLEKRRVLILCSLASTTPGSPSLAPTSPQTRWTCFFPTGCFHMIGVLDIYECLMNNEQCLTADRWSNDGRAITDHARLYEGGGRHCALQVWSEKESFLYYKILLVRLRHILVQYFLTLTNEAYICTVTVWRVLVLPVKRIVWNTWSWKLVALKWIRQTPATRGKDKILLFLWNWMTKKLMPILSASQDATCVFASSQQRPISAPISGLEKHTGNTWFGSTTNAFQACSYGRGKAQPCKEHSLPSLPENVLSQGPHDRTR